MKIELSPVPPYDFDLSCKIFSEGDAQIRRYEGGAFFQVISSGGRLLLVTLHSYGTVDSPRLQADLDSDMDLSSSDGAAAAEIISDLFNLDMDLIPFYEHIQGDRVMALLARRLRGLKSPSTSTVFEALIDSIIEQQISIKAAWSLERRLVRAFGDVLKLGKDVYYAYPTPERLVRATAEELRGCGLSTRKAEYVQNISALVRDGLDLEKFKAYYDIREIISELCEIRGIGVWTAELAILRSMHRSDAMPADDLGLRRCIARYYCQGKRVTGNEARRISETWGDWKGLAGFYLLTAERMDIVI
jgi:DNA-3-methyladenine glycosylase II